MKAAVDRGRQYSFQFESLIAGRRGATVLSHFPMRFIKTNRWDTMHARWNNKSSDASIKIRDALELLWPKSHWT
jgi:hypothetical protein